MKKIILALMPLLISSQAFAFSSPLGIAVLDPVQFPARDFNVTGLRASLLFGHHRSVYGLDFGLLGNMTDLESSSLAVSGLFNLTNGESSFIGGQFAGVTNVNTNKITVVGVQFSSVVNYNAAESTIGGVQLSAINYAPFTKVYGIQFGVFNRALEVNGLQIGLLNWTENLHGIQIGLLNFYKSGLFIVSPILNAGF